MDFFEYTPALQEPKTLESTLVGRNPEIKNISRILKSASSGKSISHPLLIGPKGIGKTHLLQFINHAVQGEIKGHGLNKYKKEFIPVIFPEEEYVDTITQFIFLVWKYLPENFKKLFPGLDKQINTSPVNEKSKEHAISFLETFKKETGKTLLLLVDNLNDILENFEEEDQSILRKILMTSNSILLIGAAPTLFSSVMNHGEPLYNFFEVIWLKDLPFKETKALLIGYAIQDQKEDLVKEIEKSEAKLRAIHELAGGNPRLILRLYHIISEGNISSVETSLLKLLDGLSPYFRERIRDLSPQQRKIIDVMAKSDILLTPTEIASHSHLAIGTVNSQIKRLEQVGYAKKASQRKKKRVLYEINERLFCLWRQMRLEAGRKRLGFIVRFLEIWYTKDELFSHLDKTLKKIHKSMESDFHTFQTCMDKLWYLKEAIGDLKDEDEICVACKREKYDVALGIVNKALKKDTEDTDMLERKGCIFVTKNEVAKAIKVFERLTKIEPKKFDSWASLGDLYMKQNKFHDAITYYEKALRLKPDYYQVLNNLGIIYGRLEQNDKAIATFEKALKVDKKNILVLVNLGEIFLRKEEYKKAMNFFKRANSIETENPIPLFSLGKGYHELKQYDKAIKVLKKAIKIYPEFYNAWNRLGITYGDNNQLSEAVKAFKKAILINPEDYGAWHNLGYAYSKDKKHKDAIQAFEKASEINPDEYAVWNNLAKLYFKIKHYGKAKDTALKAIKIGPECDCPLNVILQIFESLFVEEGLKGNYEIATRNLRELLKIHRKVENKELVHEFFVSSLKTMVEKNKIDLIKVTLNEIHSAKQKELLELLRPFSKLINYLETKNMDIIERLRKEERKVVEEMLKELEECEPGIMNN